MADNSAPAAQTGPSSDPASVSTSSSSSSGTASAALASQLQQTTLATPVAQPVAKKKQKDKYAFWETQPVVQFDAAGQPAQDGPIDAHKTPADVRQEPYNLPESFEWSVCNFDDGVVIREVYELLSNNYVEDDDAMFRFNYSPAFLKWALQPPGFVAEWLLGVRVKANQRLVGFISGIPADVRVGASTLRMAEINFLCVHKKLRSKRLAPVLIKEITRRVNLKDIWQASYTAGVLLPKPIATCRYWHRSLNPKKLIEIGFSRLAPRMTLARTLKLYKLPDKVVTQGLRSFQFRDAEQTAAILNRYLSRFTLAQVFSSAEVGHWFVPQANVVDAWVVEASDGSITDLVSFYTLPSTILGHPDHSELKAAYMYYTVAGTVPLRQLLTDALVLAAGKGYDVYNALDLMENSELVKDLKFGMGDGLLNYYLFNWGLAQQLTPNDVGLVLM